MLTSIIPTPNRGKTRKPAPTPRTRAAKRRALHSRRQADLFDSILTIPKPWLLEMNRLSAQFRTDFAHHPELLPVVLDFLVLHFRHKVAVFLISNFIDQWMAAPDRAAFYHENSQSISLFIHARHSLDRPLGRCVRTLCAAMVRFPDLGDPAPIARAAAA